MDNFTVLALMPLSQGCAAQQQVGNRRMKAGTAKPYLPQQQANLPVD